MTRPTKMQDIPEFLAKMDALLDAPTDDPKVLIKALRGITLASLYVGGFAESSHFKSLVANAVDICTAYVQACIVHQRPSAYEAIVRKWIEDVGNMAMRDLPN